jgi:hypothetical protein
MNSKMQKHGVVKVIRTDKASVSFQFKALTLSGAFSRSKAGIYGRISIGGYRDYPEIISQAPFPCTKLFKNSPFYGYANLIAPPKRCLQPDIIIFSPVNGVLR